MLQTVRRQRPGSRQSEAQVGAVVEAVVAEEVGAAAEAVDVDVGVAVAAVAGSVVVLAQESILRISILAVNFFGQFFIRYKNEQISIQKQQAFL
jgi:hypothetical protein